MAAASAGMSECPRRWTKDSAVGIGWIFHESRREGRRNFKNPVSAIRKRRDHSINRLVREESAPTHFAAVCQQSVKLGNRRCTSNATERDNRLGTDFRFVHRADCLQTMGRGESSLLQCAGPREFAVKPGWFRRRATFGGIDVGASGIEFRGQTDPKVERERIGKGLPPIARN